MTHPPQMLPEVLGGQEGKCTSAFTRRKTLSRLGAGGCFTYLQQVYHRNGGTPGMRYHPPHKVGYWEQPHRDRPSHRQHNQRLCCIIQAWPLPLQNGELGTTVHNVWNCDGNKGWWETKPKSHSSKMSQEPSRNSRLTCS